MSTQQSGLVAGNKQNEAGGATGKSRSRFPLSYTFLTTERFAEYTPFFVEEGVSGDRLPLHSNHEVQTYTLKSPVLQNLLKKKDYFVVPMQAILPLNWEKFYTNPNIGEDVPVDSGCGVVNFWSKIRTLFNASWNTLKTKVQGADADEFGDTCVPDIIRFLIFFERFYSAGSLLEHLGTSGHNYFRGKKGEQSYGFDNFVDDCLALIQSDLVDNQTWITFTQGGDTFDVEASSIYQTSGGNNVVVLREALELWRDNMTFEMSYNAGSDLADKFVELFDDVDFYLPETDSPLNLARLWAYQLVVAHYYSNDHVDYIYSAELFRQYINQLVTGTGGTNPVITYDITFSVNGYQYVYDSLSAFYMNRVLSNYSSAQGIFAINSTSGFATRNESYAYFTALFSFKRSLRFMDYFTGSRAYPLAVGDSTVNVNAGKVSVIDLSRSSMMTKFLQAVNRSGRKFGAYMQELFGITPKYDYHNPLYLAHTSDLVGAQETDNTAEAQVTDKIAVTSRLRATSSRYAFEYEPDRDCIVIGISYYDLPRVYSRATERQNFFLDRFDMFNPYMQFIGDQSISEAELGTDTPSVSLPFSYTNRHMEYKQRYNQCAGGFCVPSTGLDHWIFVADELRRRSIHHIGPSFIRSFNSELDKFYQSLTGYSLGTYFHFIVRYDNRQDASRPMAYNPTINV